MTSDLDATVIGADSGYNNHLFWPLIITTLIMQNKPSRKAALGVFMLLCQLSARSSHLEFQI